MTTSLDGKEVSLAVLPQLDVMFIIKEEQRAALEAFFSGKAVSAGFTLDWQFS